MKIKRKSPLTGKTNTMDIKISKKQLNDIRYKHIDQVVPKLTKIEKEFIITGYTHQDYCQIVF